MTDGLDTYGANTVLCDVAKVDPCFNCIFLDELCLRISFLKFVKKIVQLFHGRIQKMF